MDFFPGSDRGVVPTVVRAPQASPADEATIRKALQTLETQKNEASQGVPTAWVKMEKPVLFGIGKTQIDAFEVAQRLSEGREVDLTPMRHSVDQTSYYATDDGGDQDDTPTTDVEERDEAIGKTARLHSEVDLLDWLAIHPT